MTLPDGWKRSRDGSSGPVVYVCESRKLLVQRLRGEWRGWRVYLRNKDIGLQFGGSLEAIEYAQQMKEGQR